MLRDPGVLYSGARNEIRGMITINVLIIVNDPAYGTGKVYNAFKLASALQKS